MFAYSPATNLSDVGFAIVTDRFVCLLGSETTSDAAAALYTLLDADETHLDDVFDAIVATHDVRRFALVEVVDPASRTFHLAVRGDVALDLEGAKATMARENLKTSPITLPRLAHVIADGADRPPSQGSARATKVSLAAAPSVPRTIEWLLALPDGSEVDARIPVVIGRRP